MWFRDFGEEKEVALSYSCIDKDYFLFPLWIGIP